MVSVGRVVWVCRSASIMFPPADTLCRSAAGLKGGTFASDISLQTTSLCRDAGIIIICHGAQAHPMRAGNESAILLTKYEELLWHKLLQEKLPHELPQHKDSYRQD